MTEKNKAAVELGSLGGKARAIRLSRDELSKIAHKGVRARLKKISKERRTEIARKAAQVRWTRKADV